MSDAASPDKQPGLVATFYSFKGGVGRSMALANVGAVMAAEKHRVLLVDWDLEAPGLEVCFRNAARLIGDPTKIPGVVDLLEAHASGGSLVWRDCLLKAEFFGHSLDIISAGQRSDDYRRRVQKLDWATLFREHRVGNYINQLREEWRAAYDFVLIDSRTGITDVGDICTVLLPDLLVLLFVTNLQNVEGIKSIMARAVKARSKLPVNRNKLLGVPVPARDERDREYQLSLEWQRVFATEFSHLYKDWLPKEIEPSDALNRLFIPYVASWSFGERIPVIESERERADPTSLGAAYTRLATLLSNRLDWYALEPNASAVGTRFELSKARDAAREAEFRAQNAQSTEARTRTRASVLAGISLAVLLLTSSTGYYWYRNRAQPIAPASTAQAPPTSTDLFAGDELRDEGKIQEALKVYEARRQFLETRLARMPGDTETLLSQVVTLNRIGSMQHTLGRLNEALTWFHASRAIVEKLAGGDPRNTEWQGHLSTAYDLIGQVLADQGKLGEALVSLQESKAIAQKLADKDPDNAVWQRNLATSYQNISTVLESQGRLIEATQSIRNSQEINKRLLDKDSNNATELRSLGFDAHQLGRLFHFRGLSDEALASFQEAKANYEELANTRPSDFGHQRELSVAYVWIGRVLQSQNKLGEALASIQASVEITSQLVAKNPDNAKWRRDYSADLKSLGSVMVTLQRPDDALKALREAESMLRTEAATFVRGSRDVVEIRRFQIEANLIKQDLKTASLTCSESQKIEDSLPINKDNQYFWKPDVVRLTIACARVADAQGDTAAAVKQLTQAIDELRQLAKLSPSDAILRQDLERARTLLAKL